MEEAIKIFINKTLSKEEENLISKNCYESLVLIINHSVTTKTSIIVNEKKNFHNATMTIEFPHTKDIDCSYMKIDSQCEWYLNGNHYMCLDLKNAPENTETFQIILKNEHEYPVLFTDLNLELLDYDKKKDTFEFWYSLIGKPVYSVKSTFLLGTFARVSDGWKFYPGFYDMR